MDHIVPILLVCACGAAAQRRGAYGVYADELADEYEPVAVAALPLHRPVPLRLPLPVLRLLSAAPLAADPADPAAAAAAAAAPPSRHAQRPHHARYPQHAHYSLAAQYPEPALYPQAARLPQQVQYPLRTKRPHAPDHRDRYVLATAPEPEYAYSSEQESGERPVYAASATSAAYSKYAGYAGYAGYAAPASYEEYDTAESAAPAPAPVVLYARPNSSGGYSYRSRPARPAAQHTAYPAAYSAAAKPHEPVLIRVQKYKLVRD